MKKIKIGKLVNKYLDVISEQCKCEVNECNLKEDETPTGISIGKHNDVPDSNFDQNELKMGIEVEKEHTDDLRIAAAIARDHLSEIPGTGKGDGYYSLLKKMEKDKK